MIRKDGAFDERLVANNVPRISTVPTKQISVEMGSGETAAAASGEMGSGKTATCTCWKPPTVATRASREMNTPAIYIDIWVT